MTRFVFAMAMLFSVAAFAEGPATQPTSPVESSHGTDVKAAAALEAQIGLRLYAEGEDYRAITALQRYRILDGTPHAAFLAHLISGQIYHRNNKPERATVSFERAVLAAPDDHHRAFGFLLATQEECIAQSFYFRCAKRLDGLSQTELSDATRDLVDYQRMYVDVVLRSKNLSAERAQRLRDPILRKKAASLLERDAAFDDLSLKSPFLAGTLSALLPGAGQLYNGKPVDALLSFLFNGVFGAALYFSVTELESVSASIVSGVLLSGFYTGNIVNAVVQSKRINARRYLSFFDALKHDHWARVAFIVSDDSVAFSYRFDWDVKGD